MRGSSLTSIHSKLGPAQNLIMLLITTLMRQSSIYRHQNSGWWQRSPTSCSGATRILRQQLYIITELEGFERYITLLRRSMTVPYDNLAKAEFEEM
jgi:hypothetical protein